MLWRTSLPTAKQEGKKLVIHMRHLVKQAGLLTLCDDFMGLISLIDTSYNGTALSPPTAAHIRSFGCSICPVYLDPPLITAHMVTISR